MAETVLENEICNSCQADVRPESLFCYNCGESLDIENTDQSVDILPQEEEITPEDAPIEKPDTEILPDEDSETNAKIIKTDAGQAAKIKEAAEKLNDKPELESAASLKKRGKTVKTKEVIITWEEHENAPNAWFIAITIFLTLFAVCVFFIAMYLR